MRRYNHQEHLDLVERLATLETRFGEQSAELNDLAANDNLRTDDELWKRYQIGQTAHLQTQRELSEVRVKVRELERVAPRRPVRRSSDSPALGRFLLSGFRGLEEAERTILISKGLKNGRFKNAIDMAAYPELNEDERMPVELIHPVPGIPVGARVASDITTGSGAGGGAMPTTGVPEVANAVLYYGGVAQMARQFEELGYLDAVHPDADDTGATGVIGKQQSNTSEKDTEYDGVEFAAVRSNSGYIDYTEEMLAAATWNLEQDLREKIRTRLGRAWDSAFTNGFAAEGVEGVIATAKKGHTVTQSAAANNLKIAGFPDLVEWLHSVPVGYRGEAAAVMAQTMADGNMAMLAGRGVTGFILHDSLLKELRLLKDGDDRPLWLPSVMGTGPGTILGYPFSIAGSWPALAKNKPMGLFGNFRAFGIRNAGTGAPIIRRYDDSGPGTNFSVRMVGFMHRDAKVRIPKNVRADGVAVSANKLADATDAYAALWAANN